MCKVRFFLFSELSWHFSVYMIENVFYIRRWELFHFFYSCFDFTSRFFFSSLNPLIIPVAVIFHKQF